MGLCKLSGRVDRILFTIFLVLVAQSAIWQYNSPGLHLVDAAGGGSWEVVVRNAGIASMHTAVTHFGNVVLLDRTNIGPSLLPLPKGICRDNRLDRVSCRSICLQEYHSTLLFREFLELCIPNKNHPSHDQSHDLLEHSTSPCSGTCLMLHQLLRSLQ